MSGLSNLTGANVRDIVASVTGDSAETAEALVREAGTSYERIAFEAREAARSMPVDPPLSDREQILVAGAYATGYVKGMAQTAEKLLRLDA